MNKNCYKLELMFMKHYAPNRCLSIKVAKLRTGVGSAEMSHLQNCSLKIYLESTGGGGGQDGCERRIKVVVKNSRKIFLWGGWGGGGVSGFGGGQGKCEQRMKFLIFFWGGQVGRGGGHRVDVNKELKFCENLIKNCKGGGGGGGGLGWGGGGGSGWNVNEELKFLWKLKKKFGGGGPGGSGWM